MKKRPAWRRPLHLVLPILLALPFTAGFSETEFACEEAWKHIEDCCGEAQGFSCETTCNSSPGTTLSQADCLRRASCDELRAAGVCDSANGWETAVCK